MDGVWAKARDIAAARRGQIVQRVLVDGWSPKEAAAAFGVGERQVKRWVAAYRRFGMASLHDPAAEAAPRRWFRRLRMVLGWFVGRRRGAADAGPASCVVLRRANDDDRSPAGPNRRSIWN